MNETTDQACQQHLEDFFKKFPNPCLQTETNRMLRNLLGFKFSMPGKPGGWAGGIIYTVTNRYKRACGIPGLLNKECEDFFDVSMSTIYKRSWMIRRLLLSTL